MTRNTIKISVIESGVGKSIETYDAEYRNLMELLKDKLNLECFGECGGMGRCATCIIKIEGVNGDSMVKDRNEPTTLLKSGLMDQDLRLSCQIMVSHDLDDAIISIID
jgi:2Fe-2S ferredoxin